MFLAIFYAALNFWFFCFKTKEQRNFFLNTFLEKVLQKSVRLPLATTNQNNAKTLFDSEPIACEASKKDGLIKNALRKTGFGALKTKYHPVVEQRKCIRCTLHQEQAKNIQLILFSVKACFLAIFYKQKTYQPLLWRGTKGEVP